MLTSFITTVHWSKLRNSHWYILLTERQILSRYHWSSTNNHFFFFFLSQDPIQDITLHVLLWFFLAVVIFQTSLVLMTLTVLKGTALRVCRMFLNWDLSDILQMVWLGLWAFGRKTLEVKCLLSHRVYPKGTCYQHDFVLLVLTLLTCLR